MLPCLQDDSHDGRHVIPLTAATGCATANSSNNDDDAASVAAKMTMPMMPAASMLQGMPFFF